MDMSCFGQFPAARNLARLAGTPDLTRRHFVAIVAACSVRNFPAFSGCFKAS